MPKYLLTGSYTAEGARGVLKEGGTGRRAATEKLIASLGGTMEAYYFASGTTTST
ncbi:MAG: GYD domain-containing protein [Candidatus Limnocylindrales bacterium]